MDSSSNILWLSEINEEDADLAGEKALRFSALYKKGFPIPQAFVITGKCFKKFLENNNIKKQIDSLLLNLDFNNFKLLKLKAEEINELIRKADFSEKLESEILESYSHLNIDNEILKKTSNTVLDLIKKGKSLPYAALRSSFISKEHNNVVFLNVKGISSLIINIKKIWTHFYNFDSIYFRKKNKFSDEDVSAAVIIQKMINSEKSGVIYYDNEVKIEAVYGIFDYSENISRDYYLLDNELYIKDKKINNKSLYLARDEFGKIIKKELDENKKISEVLNNDEVKKLSEYYKKLQEIYKKNVKFEFSIENSKIYIIDLNLD